MTHLYYLSAVHVQFLHRAGLLTQEDATAVIAHGSLPLNAVAAPLIFTLDRVGDIVIQSVPHDTDETVATVIMATDALTAREFYDKFLYYLGVHR